MKYLLHTAFAAALIAVSGYSYAAQNGINYDPAHNPAYVQAQRDNRVDVIRNIITTDLAQIKNTLEFNTIKTYYSQYCTYAGPPNCVPIAQLANTAGVQVLLGVYEFEPRDGCRDNRECITWTKPQVDEAINSANAYGNTIIDIVVGNEDMFDFRGDAVPELQQRIVNDINTIKAGVTDKSLVVTTAQRQPDWCGGPMPGCASTRTNSLNQQDPYGVLKTVHVIGVNIFPYWGGSDEKINGVSVASITQITAMNLKTALSDKGVANVIVTEEGWPSCSAPGQPPARPHPTTVDDEIDYFQTWSIHANQVFDSVYFMAYDLQPVSGCGGGADHHFGLCASSGATKDSRLIGCGLGAAGTPSFAGTPGLPNCERQSITALDRQYGGRNGAAAALGFSNVRALEKAIVAFCR